MAFSSVLPTLKLSNRKNPKLKKKKEGKLYFCSTKQAPIQVDTSINMCPRKVKQETTLNKSHEVKVLKVTGKYSKQKDVLIHTAA